MVGGYSYHTTSGGTNEGPATFELYGSHPEKQLSTIRKKQIAESGYN
jgi:hypothetical protein